eukprot:COSAG02_NODE_3573_length_6541_cov_3.507451_1_plen_129_part_00
MVLFAGAYDSQGAHAQGRKAAGGRARKPTACSQAAAGMVNSLVPASLQQDIDETLPPDVRDIDAGEDDDPTLVSCYARPVYKHLLEVEVRLERNFYGIHLLIASAAARSKSIAPTRTTCNARTTSTTT